MRCLCFAVAFSCLFWSTWHYQATVSGPAIVASKTEGQLKAWWTELKSGVVTAEHQNLLLSGYDAHDPSGRRIVKCINNRRLLALKRFSKDHPFPIQVRVRIIPDGEAVVRNSDSRTDGVDIVVQDRQSARMGHSESWQHSPRSARSNSDRSGRNSERSGQW